jgi:hypothetical protein
MPDLLALTGPGSELVYAALNLDQLMQAGHSNVYTTDPNRNRQGEYIEKRRLDLILECGQT